MTKSSLFKLASVTAAAGCFFAISNATLATASGSVSTYGDCGVKSVKFNIDGSGTVNAICPVVKNPIIWAYFGHNGCPSADSDALMEALAVAVDHTDRLDLQFTTASNGNTCLYSATKTL